jgi:hypothetical protein
VSENRTTIGLTPENKEVMEEVMPYFNEQRDAAKFVMALAIEEGYEPNKVRNAKTVWNVGSFDPDGEFRDLIKALYRDVNQPYTAIEYFINQGFRILDEHLEQEKDLNILENI